MPVPYSSQQQQPMAPPSGTQGQLVCSGCRTLLVYQQGAANVRCALCSTVTPVPPPGTAMAQLICGGCHTLLMYLRGATSVHCSCCHTVNLSMEANQVAHVNCGGCGTMLMFPFGAQSVKCSLCQFVTSPGSSSQAQTVVVENPMTLDQSGKLVSNVAVGVTMDKKG